MKKLLFILFLVVASCKDENLSEPLSDECIDPTRWGVIEACYKIYDPVCGCNEITYSNDCEAKAAGVVNWTRGKCTK
jgi:hypothetical protein